MLLGNTPREHSSSTSPSFHPSDSVRHVRTSPLNTPFTVARALSKFVRNLRITEQLCHVFFSPSPLSSVSRALSTSNTRVSFPTSADRRVQTCMHSSVYGWPRHERVRIGHVPRLPKQRGVWLTAENVGEKWTSSLARTGKVDYGTGPSTRSMFSSTSTSIWLLLFRARRSRRSCRSCIGSVVTLVAELSTYSRLALCYYKRLAFLLWRICISFKIYKAG